MPKQCDIQQNPLLELLGVSPATGTSVERVQSIDRFSPLFAGYVATKAFFFIERKKAALSLPNKSDCKQNMPTLQKNLRTPPFFRRVRFFCFIGFIWLGGMLFFLKTEKTLENQGFQQRMTGVEPASKAWEAFILPMNYIRKKDIFFL